MQATQKLFGMARDKRKTLKKEKEKWIIRRSQTATAIFFYFYYFI